MVPELWKYPIRSLNYHNRSNSILESDMARHAWGGDLTGEGVIWLDAGWVASASWLAAAWIVADAEFKVRGSWFFLLHISTHFFSFFLHIFLFSSHLSPLLPMKFLDRRAGARVPTHPQTPKSAPRGMSNFKWFYEGVFAILFFQQNISYVSCYWLVGVGLELLVTLWVSKIHASNKILRW